MLKPYRSRFFLFSALALSVISSPASLKAQQAPQAPMPLATHPAQDGNLTLDVAVTTRDGKPITGLTRQDFTVLDNKQPASILSFTAQTLKTERDEPVEITFVVDEVNAGISTVSFERDQIRDFVRKSGNELTHPMRLVFFSDTSTEIQRTTTTSGGQLLAAFDEHVTKLRTIRRSTGFYGAVERFQLSFATLGRLADTEAQTPGRKIVIWISPGWPLLIDTQDSLTAAERRTLFQNVKSLSASLRAARITLYNIDPLGVADAASFRSSYYTQFLKPVSSAKKTEVANLALQVVAVQTGGLALNPSNDLSGQIAHVVQDADSFYTLTIAASPADSPDAFHTIEVRTTQPGAIARTRNGYYPEQ